MLIGQTECPCSIGVVRRYRHVSLCTPGEGGGMHGPEKVLEARAGQEAFGAHIERAGQNGMARVVLGMKMKGATHHRLTEEEETCGGQPKADSLKPSCNVTSTLPTPHTHTRTFSSWGGSSRFRGHGLKSAPRPLSRSPLYSIPTLRICKVGRIRSN